jgi:anaerobic nitric oxide reductase transcription regulator
VPLLDAALSLSEAPTAHDALDGILRALARTTPVDAVAVLLAAEDGALDVASQLGLTPASRGLRLQPPEHPRLSRALRAPGPIRFSDPREPDPYDGLLAGRAGPVDPIHACLAVPLYRRKKLVGVLTMDALDPRGLDGIRDDDVRIFAALAAAAAPAPAPAGGGRSRPDDRRMLGRSPAMARLDREIQLLAPLPTTVLVHGETGTGKELVARALHARSPRAAGPLVIVNCAALSAQLVESELFGHVKGAYTGATASRAGRFEAARGGTLVLDEVGELPLPAQAQLLRALQEGEIQRVGDDRTHRVEVRVIAVTNRDLWREVEEGRFRADLLHRLWVIPVHTPPLRDRAEDIPLLAAHFAAVFAAQIGGRAVRLHGEAVERLAGHAWPGNVRELDNAVRRAILRRMADAPAGGRLELRPDDFELEGSPRAASPPRRATASAETLADALARVRREAFEQAFAGAGGNAAEAARRLGVSRSFAYKEGLRLGLIEGKR